MSITQRRSHLLQQMQAITRMERGKLCAQSRGPGTPTFYKLQAWHQGQNATRYVPAEEVPALKEALAGHQRFQELAAEFADLTITHTRQAAAEDSKKKRRSTATSRTNVSGKPTSS